MTAETVLVTFATASVALNAWWLREAWGEIKALRTARGQHADRLATLEARDGDITRVEGELEHLGLEHIDLKLAVGKTEVRVDELRDDVGRLQRRVSNAH